MKRVLFIDGSNLYAGQFELFGPNRYLNGNLFLNEIEVDVKLAVDIVDMAYRNKFDELYLLSGDADFMHALKIAQSKKKGITVLALHNRIPFRFIHHFKTIILGKEKNLKKHSLLKK